MTPRPTIVLVHGAFSDASAWDAVTEGLQASGHTVIAPAIPLRGLGTDAAYLHSVLEAITGPVVVVGHAYGGAVLTNAVAPHHDVTALVYISAYAPDEADTVGDLTTMHPGSMLGPDNLVIRPHPGGSDGYIDPSRFREIFAADIDPDTAAVMAASQRPVDLGILSEPSGPPAWKAIRAWYVVATEDNVIPPATQRFMARRGAATTVEVRSSHVVMMSHPAPVVDVILEAAAHDVVPTG